MKVRLAIHAMPIPDGAPEWIHLLPTGEFSGKGGDGPYQLKNAESVIAASIAPGAPLPIDYDHQIDFAVAKRVGGTAPAAGWIVELQSRSDGLWGKVEWTEKGRTVVQAREYRFISPVYNHSITDGTVKRLLRAALTNHPNLDLVALNSAAGSLDDTSTQESESMEKFFEQMMAVFGFKPDADQALAIQAAKDAVAAQLEAKILSQIVTKLNGGPLELKAVQSAADDTARASAVDGVVRDLKAKLAVADPAKIDPGKGTTGQGDEDTVIQSLQTQVNQLLAAAATGAAQGAVDEALKAGKIAPATKDWAIRYATQDLDGFKNFVAAQPEILKPGTTIVSGPPSAGKDGLSADEIAICSSMGLDPKKYKETRDAAATAQ
jgi:phage I-like protein|tara:strand:- start:20033 stop:21166 length:1134 start_codon:yes stop_codon:yes gene_type:complete